LDRAAPLSPNGIRRGSHLKKVQRRPLLVILGALSGSSWPKTVSNAASAEYLGTGSNVASFFAITLLPSMI
jgi:hypothetical protein